MKIGIWNESIQEEAENIDAGKFSNKKLFLNYSLNMQRK